MASEFSPKETAKIKEAMAHLSLAADKKGVEPPCLSDEDLALLVEDFKAGKDLTRFKEHLSSCNECYDRWMSLVSVQLAASLRPEGKVHFLPGLLKQRYLGSALAVAAAIALFLNIYETDQLVMQPPSQKIAERKVVPAERVESETEPTIEDKELQEKPVAATRSKSPVSPVSAVSQVPIQKKTASKERVNDTFRKKAATASKKELKLLAPVTMQVERQSMDAVEEFTTKRKQNQAQDVEASLQEWFTKVSYGCKKEQKNEKYWQARKKEWKKLVSNKAHRRVVSEETRQKAEKIAALLQKNPGESITPRCEEILEILAEDPVSR